MTELLCEFQQEVGLIISFKLLKKSLHDLDQIQKAIICNMLHHKKWKDEFPFNLLLSWYLQGGHGSDCERFLS